MKNPLLRGCPPLVAALIITLAGWSMPAAQAINVSEPPDFPNSSTGVTAAFTYTLSSGTNTFSGTVTTPNDGQDNFAVVVPAGLQILGVTETITPVSGQSFSGGATFNTLYLDGTGTQTFPIGSVPLPAGTYAAFVNANFSVGNSWSMTITTGPVPDYSIINQSGTITVTDNTTSANTLAVSLPSSGNLGFAATGHTFRVNSGVLNTGSSGNVSLSSVTNLVLNSGAGGETINLGALGSSFPQLTVNGGPGNDTVNFNGSITFAAGNGLSVYLQSGSPGADTITVSSAAQLTCSAGGAIDLECSRNIALSAGAVLQTYSGSITLAANQQATATTGSFSGVTLDGSGTKLTTAVGTITVQGVGGNGAGGSQAGVSLTGGAQIVGGSLPVNVTGVGGASTGTANRGVVVSGTGSAITTTGPSITVAGTGGAAGSGAGTGVSVLSGGQIGSGTGQLSLTGTGAGASNSSANQGVEIAQVGSLVTAKTQVTVTATSGPGVSSGLTMYSAASMTATSNGGIECFLDSLSLADTASMAATDPASLVTLIPAGAAVRIDLGGTVAAGNLALSDAVLDHISATEIDFVSTDGALTISAPITRPSATNLKLLTGSGFEIIAAASGTDLSVGAGTVTLAAPLSMSITGAAADTGVPQLNVAGGLNLNGVALDLTGTLFAGTLGQVFTIIPRNGRDNVVGTFANLPEGALLAWPGSPLFYARISYAGGAAGNDVTLTLVSGLAVTTTADTGVGSLRNAIANAAAHSGVDTVTFDASLNGATITLSGPANDYAIGVADSAGVTLDASNLSGGLTIAGGGSGGSFGLFFVGNGSSLTMRGLTLKNGGGTAFTANSKNGGAIFNNGTLTLVGCTLTGNSARSGGAVIGSTGTTLTLTQCTLSGNSASGDGGAITSGGTLMVAQCTLSGNFTGSSSGAIENGGALTLTNSIVAGNTGGDIFNLNPCVVVGANVVQSLSGGTTGSGTILNAAPLLAPLGSYGGATQTMPPLPGSPAIDHGVILSIPLDPATGMAFTTDQRGFPRISNNVVDIGAVETSAIQVTTLADDGSAGSLRKQIAAATDITTTLAFASGLAGGTITLTPATGDIAPANNVALDATALTGGLTISGGNATRLFTVNSGRTVAFLGLTLTGGNGASTTSSGNGGAIYNNGGTLTLNQCLLTGNTTTGNSTVGGAVRQNTGTLTLNRCTVANNTAVGTSSTAGGIGIASPSTVTLNQCTLAGNTAASSGGALKNNSGATLTLNQCTVANNTAATLGGGLNNQGTATVNNSIVATNNATTGADINNDSAATLTKAGASIVLTYSGTAATGSGSFIVGYPVLAPLDYYGGPTPTMATEPLSPARNAAAGSTFTTDQRGFPVVGTPDIGAYEAGTLAPNYNAYIWESLPASSSIAQHAAAADYDGDGVSNYNEWLAQTNAADPTSYLQLTQVSRAGSNFTFTFPTVTGRHYTVETSPDLITWTTASGSIAGFNGSLTDTLQASGARFFVRVRVGP